MALAEDSLHIDSPRLVSRRRRAADALFTGFMWAVYSYLWAPLISLLAWLLGFEFAYDVMVRAGGFEAFKDVIGIYSIMVACIFIVVAGWSTINRQRYAHRDRRHAIEPVADAEIAAYFGIPSARVKALRDARVSRVRVNDEGRIESVEARILTVQAESAGPVGPEGGIAQNEPGDDDGKDDSLVQGPA